MRLNKAKIVEIQLSQCHAPESKRQKKGVTGMVMAVRRQRQTLPVFQFNIQRIRYVTQIIFPIFNFKSQTNIFPNVCSGVCEI